MGDQYRDEPPAEDGVFWVKERATGHDWVAVWEAGWVFVDDLERDPSEFRWGRSVTSRDPSAPPGDLYAW